MYTLNEYLPIFVGDDLPEKGWDSGMYTYSPGLPVDVIATSDDFHGLCLMADEHVTIEAPSVHDLVHLAYLPIVQLHEPKQTLPLDAAQHLSAKMREIIGYL